MNELIVICDKPIISERFQFLVDHLDCDIIADISEEEETDTIKVIAYSKSRKGNKELYDYFYSNNYSGKYKIIKNISRGMVIDSVD